MKIALAALGFIDNDIDIARGGALYISNKKIVDEILSGKEDILIVEV